MLKQRMCTIFERFAEKLLNKKVQAREVPHVSLDNKLQKDSFDGNVAEAFEIYILIHSLADNNVADRHLEKESFDNN